MKRLLIFLSLIGFAFHANCQYYNSPTYTSTRTVKDSNNTGLIGFYGMFNNPIGNFLNEGYQSGGGFGMEMYTKNLNGNSPNGLKVKFGGSLYYAGQGSITNSVRLHDPKNAPGTQRFNNFYYGGDLRLKFLSDKGSVRPYVDIFGGFANFSSNERLTINTPIYGYQTSTKYAVYTIPVYTYGASFGFLIKLSDNVFFDLKSTFMTSSTSVSFVNFNQLYSDGYMYVPANHSANPLILSLQFGLVFRLRPSCNYSTSSYGGPSYSPVYYNSGYRYRSSGSYYHSYHRSCGSHRSGGGKPLR